MVSAMSAQASQEAPAPDACRQAAHRQRQPAVAQVARLRMPPMRQIFLTGSMQMQLPQRQKCKHYLSAGRNRNHNVCPEQIWRNHHRTDSTDVKSTKAARCPEVSENYLSHIKTRIVRSPPITA